MTLVAPPIDSRTAPEIEQQVVALIKTYAPEWNEVDPATGRATGISAGLVGVFARVAELTLERLNRAPEKNELAFLDLIGATPLPAQPARAPVTFALAAGARTAAVPARTPVAAAPAAGGGAPVVFETLREIALTPATLARVMTWDALADRKSDHSRVADPANGAPVILFRGDGELEHAVYFGLDDLLGNPMISECGINVTLDTEPPLPVDARSVQWEIWDGEKGIPLTPVSVDGGPADSTNALSRSGFVGFGTIPQVPLTKVNGVTSRWLRCRLLTPITISAEPVAGFVRATHLPAIGGALINGVGYAPPTLPDAAFQGAIRLDTSRDFEPFGGAPSFGSTWYLASRAILSQRARRIRLSLTMTDPGSGLAARAPSTNLSLKWEYFTDAGWTDLGYTSPAGTSPIDTSYLADTSTVCTSNGEISFVLNAPPRPTVVNGVENYWIRVSLVRGTFYAGGVPAGPFIGRATLSYDTTNTGFRFQATNLIVQEDAISARAVRRFEGYKAGGLGPADDAGRSLYLGFSLPEGTASRPISMWADVAPIAAGVVPDMPLASAWPQLSWTYWNGTDWSAIRVADETDAFTGSGEVRFIFPADIARGSFFRTFDLFWLRATWSGGDYKFLPRLRRLMLNTTLAEQAVTIAAETLGTSNGEPGQSFKAAQVPLLDGVALDVGERELPSPVEQAAIMAAAGADAITAVSGGGVTVRWTEVGDFYGSGPRDRHFVVDHQTGGIGFGDGVNGLVPPRGSALVLARYRTGGGTAGDVAAGSISQLKTTLPYVGGVTNPVAATGGVGAETLDEMRTRAPRQIRHGDRAVTVDDFQDLARLASPEVARSLCVPLHDLSVDPDGTTTRPGMVSIIVVPRSDDPAPKLGADLAGRVTDHLAARMPATVEAVVVGPEYVTVDVRAEINLARPEDAGPVETAVRAALAAFLHPLTGGDRGTGWDFGRRPHRSDLTTLIQAIDGVDHIRGLKVTATPLRAGAIETSRFLVCSGQHRIDLSFGSL